MAEKGKGYPHRFAEVVQAMGKEPGVTFGQPGAKKTFGHSALKVNDKIFAMVSSKGAFVVKLLKQRVAELEKGRLDHPSYSRIRFSFSARPGVPRHRQNGAPASA